MNTNPNDDDTEIMFNYNETFYRITKNYFFPKVFITMDANLYERTMFFTAAKELYKLGYGTDYSDHPSNPLNENHSN